MGLIHAWAVGGPALIIPEVAGFPMGPGPGRAKHVVIEIHFDNPNLVAGVNDATGIRLNYTTNIRQYDAAVMTLGDPLVTFEDIPPGQERVHYEGECPSECTSEWNDTIIVFADFLHMHEKGAMIWSNHWRGEEFLGEILNIEYWVSVVVHFRQTII